MKSTFSIKKLIMIFLIITIVALIIDYYNVMYPILEVGIEKESLPITVMESIKKANIWDLYKRNLNKILIGA